MKIPPINEIIENMYVVSLQLNTQFRNIQEREIALWESPNGWVEFSPFLEYSPNKCAPWLLSSIELGYGKAIEAKQSFVKVNAIIPAIPVHKIESIIEKFHEVDTFKIKVAQKYQTLEDDIARVKEIRRRIPYGNIRLDANGGWSLPQAIKALNILARFNIEYVEQPVRTIEEIDKLKKETNIPIAIDESLRFSHNILKTISHQSVDVLIFKVAPLGGITKIKTLSKLTNKKIVISSALESSIGMYYNAVGASIICPNTVCGLGTIPLFKEDICQKPLLPKNGYLEILKPTPSMNLLKKYATNNSRKKWWAERIKKIYEIIIL